MKIENSKSFELSLKDIGNIGFLVLSFVWGFYFTNTELVNQFIGHHVSPEYVWIATAFIYYFFKQLVKDNSKK